MVRIKLRDGRVVTDYHSGNLKGTCRTLDVTAGIITLGDGVCSKDGVAILDDSKTLILTDDGKYRKITPRECFNVQGYPRDFVLPGRGNDGKVIITPLDVFLIVGVGVGEFG